MILEIIMLVALGCTLIVLSLLMIREVFQCYGLNWIGWVIAISLMVGGVSTCTRAVNLNKINDERMKRIRK